METIFRWSGEPPKYDKAELCTLELHHFGLLDNGMYKGGKVCYVDNCIHDYLSLLDLKKIGIDLGYKVDITQRVTDLKVYYKGPAKSGQHAVNEAVNDSCIPRLVGSISLDQVLVLYYHDPTHNNELESVDEKQEQHSETEIGNEEEEEEKEDVIVDSDYEVSEEENGNEEAAYVHDGPPVEEAACFEEMKEMPINEATWQISDDGEDSDRLPSDGDSFGGEEDGRKKTSKRKWKMPAFKQFRKETDLRNPEFRIGMQFGNKEELKEAIREYAIVQGRQVKLVKNDNRRIQAKCVGHTRCPFILFASKIDRDEETFAIKTLSLEHKCTRVDKLKYTNSRWLSIRFADKIRKNPEWDVGAFQSEVLEKYHMNVSRHQIYRAKNLSKVIIEGSYVEQYARLWDYAEELKKANKGSTVIIKNKMNGDVPVFQRIYVCLEACKRGFLAGCRPLIGIDGCHLKGPYTGQVLTAVGVDGNNGMYPVAYAVVELESKSSWIWFLELLIADLKIENGKAWVIISDKQKGIIPEIETLLPTAEHRMCVRHIYSNFRKEHAGLALKRRLMYGIPCSHAISCIFQKEANVFDYAHDCYKKEAYLSSYEPMVHPIPSMDQWQRTNWPPIKPPPYKKQPGRPKKSRNKEPAEVEVPAPVPPNPLPPFYNPPPTKLRRIYVKVRCSVCGQEGHNKTRHENEGAAQAQPNQPNPTIGRGRGRGRGRGTTTGRGRGNGRGQMPIGTGNGGGNVGNGATSSQPLPSSQPFSYTGATSSSSQPPNIVEVASQPSKSPAKRFKAPANRVKSPAKRFKSPAKKLRPWMW
ncbi:hypothetical protein CerSpe_158640 [Prunus speciosa]